MEWKTVRKNEVKQIIDGWNTLGEVCPEYSKGNESYRESLIYMFNEVKSELGIETVRGKEYKFDLLFGRELYSRLNREFGITESLAANDDFWITLGVKFVPDIVFWRWGPQAHDRFYNNSRRIWLKALWWYWHLSWQGDEKITQRVLEANTTDEIVQLVERSGTSGYRVDLCRAIMRQYGIHCLLSGSGDAKLFRRVMKLNTARLAVIEPALYEGEEQGYVKDLFTDLAKSQ